MYRPSRSSRRRILPDAVFGISLTKTKRRGRLKLARSGLSRQKRSSSSAVTPAPGTTKAATRSPNLSSASPATATLDAGVARESLLDLDRMDVLAAADDHVVDAPGDVEVAVGVDVSHVAGEVPAVAERRRVGVGAVPVAREGLVGGEARDDLALRPRRDDLVGSHATLGARDDDSQLRVDPGPACAPGLEPHVGIDREGVDLGRAVVIDEDLRP